MYLILYQILHFFFHIPAKDIDDLLKGWKKLHQQDNIPLLYLL